MKVETVLSGQFALTRSRAVSRERRLCSTGVNWRISVVASREAVSLAILGDLQSGTTLNTF